MRFSANKNGLILKVFLFGLAFCPHLSADPVTPPVASKPTPAAETPSTDIDWNNLQIGVTVATGGGTKVGPSIQYFPNFATELAGSPINLGLDLGISGFNSAGNTAFLLLQYGVEAARRIDPNWEVRFSLGLQTWTAGNGTAFYLGPDVIYLFDHDDDLFVDGIFVAYSAVFQSTFANLITAGINIKF